MKLDELLGVKKFYDKHLEDVKKAFVGNGSLYKKLGQGATATAYAQGDEYVYKFWLMDTAYEKYVDYCLDNQDNPHIPVLYSDIKNLHSFFTRTTNFPEKIHYIKMERLEKITENTKWPGVTVKKRDPTKSWEPTPPKISTIISRMYWKFCNSDVTEEDFKEKFKAYLESMQVEASPKAFEEICAVYKIMVDLRKIYKNTSSVDYHSGNIMMRGDTIVIIDPYADEASMDSSERIGTAMFVLNRELKNSKKQKSIAKNVRSDYVQGPTPKRKQ